MPSILLNVITYYIDEKKSSSGILYAYKECVYKGRNTCVIKLLCFLIGIFCLANQRFSGENRKFVSLYKPSGETRSDTLLFRGYASQTFMELKHWKGSF